MPMVKGAKRRPDGSYEMPGKKDATPPKRSPPKKPAPEEEEDEEEETEEPEEGEDEELVPSSQVGIKPRPKQPDEEDEPEDEEEQFITAKDLHTIPDGKSIDTTPGKPGFIADIIEGILWKVDDVEFGLTGHPVFQRSGADAKIERGIGEYVESVIDPKKYGVVVLVGAYVGSQALKWGIYGVDLQRERAKRNKKGKKR